MIWLIAYVAVAVVIAGVGAFFSGREDDPDITAIGIVVGLIWPLALAALVIALPFNLLFLLGRRTAP